MTKPNKKTFTNRKQEADFWERNIDQVIGSSKPTKVTFTKNLTETINIRLDQPTLDKVRLEAHRKGIGPTQLIRMWVKEKTHESNSK